MDPISLAVGLAGLFNTCVDVIERTQDYKSFDADSEDLTAQLDSFKIRFERWGREVGLDQQGGRLKDTEGVLGDPKVSSAVENLLRSIDRVFKEEESDEAKGSDEKGKASLGQSSLSERSSKGSKWGKVRWVMAGKATRVKQVTIFGEAVKRLYELVPVGDDPLASAANKFDLTELEEGIARLEADSKGNVWHRPKFAVASKGKLTDYLSRDGEGRPCVARRQLQVLL